MDGLLGAVGGRISQRLLGATLITLAFAGVALVIWSSGDGGAFVSGCADRLGDRPGVVQGLAVAAALGATVVAALAADRLGRPVLRLLAGYWPGWLAPLRNRPVRRIGRRAGADHDRLQELQAHPGPGPAERAERARLERRTRYLPSSADDYMPTRVGNILRAAQTRPAARYGIDPVAVWPHLYLVLPDAVRHALTQAGQSVDRVVLAIVWSTCLVALTPWVWWAAVVGLAGAAAGVLVALPAAARTHADLVEAAVDLHRLDLYQRLRWPMPATPAAEHAAGETLTSYLVNGSDDVIPRFTTDPA